MSNSSSLPPAVAKYFWGDDLTQLNPQQHQSYISKTILEKGDLESVRWLLETYPTSALQAESAKLEPKSRNYWQLYFTHHA